MNTAQNTPAADVQAAIKKTLHSAAFAKFMGQAVQTALAEAAQRTSSIILTPITTAAVRFNDSGVACSYTARSLDGKSEFRMQRSFENLEHPELRHHWYGYEEHTDASGRVWSSRLPHMVQDDFGNLVEVAE